MSFMDSDFREKNGVYSISADNIGFSLDEKYVELAKCNEDIEKMYYDLGKTYYQTWGKEADGSLDAMVRNIDSLRTEAEQIQEEIDQISALALCPKCGSRNSSGIRFCPYCGTPVESIGEMYKAEQMQKVTSATKAQVTSEPEAIAEPDEEPEVQDISEVHVVPEKMEMPVEEEVQETPAPVADIQENVAAVEMTEEESQPARRGFKAIKFNIGKEAEKPVESVQKKCANCGADIEDGDMFCMNCGHRI